MMQRVIGQLFLGGVFHPRGVEDPLALFGPAPWSLPRVQRDEDPFRRGFPLTLPEQYGSEATKPSSQLDFTRFLERLLMLIKCVVGAEAGEVVAAHD